MENSKECKKILLIEDDQRVSRSLELALTAREFNVTIIADGFQALEHLSKLDSSSYDLILLDIMLPRASGWEILVKIRSLSEISHIPVIMLTAVDDEISESRALYDGADDFIKKPFSMKVLLARIEAHLRKVSPFKDLNISLSKEGMEELTPREKELLYWIVKGYSNKELAEKFFLSETTVRNHVSNIFRKCRVENRIQLAILALKYNLIQ